MNQPSVALPNASFAITASPTGLSPGTYVGVIAVTDDAGEVQLYSCTLTVVTNNTRTITALRHFAAQDIWTTGIFAVNTLSTGGSFNITFRDDFGKLIGLPFNTGLTATLPGSLSGFGSAYFEASDPTKTLIDGWAQITADPGVVIQALFRENSNGNSISKRPYRRTPGARNSRSRSMPPYSPLPAISFSLVSQLRIWIV